MNDQKLMFNSACAMDDELLAKADAYLKGFSFAPKDLLHVRLLIEETLGMLREMTGDYSAMLWVETQGMLCRLHVTARADVDINSKKDLLSVSKTGKNTMAKGFMAKLGDMIENGILNYENTMALQQRYGMGYIDVATMNANPSEVVFAWTLDQYRKSVSTGREQTEDAAQAWDELEKSIVANLARDIKVGVRKNHVEMVIETELKGK